MTSDKKDLQGASVGPEEKANFQAGAALEYILS
jgi:hypothetical protein